MNLLKTKYYPVDLDQKVIINDPRNRERDVAWNYSSKVIGIKGRDLTEHPRYAREFAITPDGSPWRKARPNLFQ